jgi:hypothetical protein
MWPRRVGGPLEVERAAVMLNGIPLREAQRRDWRSVSLRAKANAQALGGTPPGAPKSVSLGPRVPLAERLFEVVA